MNSFKTKKRRLLVLSNNLFLLSQILTILMEPFSFSVNISANFLTGLHCSKKGLERLMFSQDVIHIQISSFPLEKFNQADRVKKLT